MGVRTGGSSGDCATGASGDAKRAIRGNPLDCPLDFFRAHEECMLRGGYLAIPRTAEEQNEVQALVNARVPYTTNVAWIGLSDKHRWDAAAGEWGGGGQNKWGGYFGSYNDSSTPFYTVPNKARSNAASDPQVYEGFDLGFHAWSANNKPQTTGSKDCAQTVNGGPAADFTKNADGSWRDAEATYGVALIGKWSERKCDQLRRRAAHAAHADAPSSP